MAMLAKQCVEEDPVLRPDMKQAVITLSQILLSSIEWEATLAGNSQVFSGLVAGRWSCKIGLVATVLSHALFGDLLPCSTRGVFPCNLLLHFVGFLPSWAVFCIFFSKYLPQCNIFLGGWYVTMYVYQMCLASSNAMILHHFIVSLLRSPVMHQCSSLWSLKLRSKGLLSSLKKKTHLLLMPKFWHLKLVVLRVEIFIITKCW